MKFAIYAISKNESANVERFMDSIAPTGIPVYVLDHSTDDTTEKLRKRGAMVDTTPITPFTFDAGKNAALALTPSDTQFAINLDLDEVLNDNFKDALFDILDKATLVRHLYRPDSKLQRTRYEMRIHRRHDYRWKYPIHECLEYVGTGPEKIQAIHECLMTQFPSADRRHTWCERLLDAVKKHPESGRMRMLCGRDLFFDYRYHEAIAQFDAYISSSDKNPYDESYVYAMRGKCRRKLGDPNKELLDLVQSVAVFDRRESYVDLSNAWLQRGEYEQCLKFAKKALAIENGEYAPHSDPGAWGFKPYEMMMISLYNLKRIKEALKAGEKAKALASGDDRKRIFENFAVIRQALAEA